MVDVEVEVPAILVVLADQAGFVGFIDGALEGFTLADIFAAEVDVAGVRAHREGGDQAALDEGVGVVAQDFAILAGAGLRFVGIDDEVGGARVFLWHERPFEAGREAGAAAAAAGRRL